jgi:hypothetical protein
MSDKTAIEWTEATCPVPGWDGYRVTADGRLYGPSGRQIRWQHAPSGHLVYTTGGRKLRIAHAVLTAWGHPRPPGALARHLNDDPADNRLSNLAWGSYSDNMADSLINGRRPTGEAVSGTGLTASAVAQIHVDRRSSRVLAAEHGVSHTTILKIKRGARWKAVTCG